VDDEDKWMCFQEKTDDDVPMPAYFRFLALLAFKIFTAEQVKSIKTAPARYPFFTIFNYYKVVGPFPIPWASGSYMHRTALLHMSRREHDCIILLV
jgi:hypothetical protein